MKKELEKNFGSNLQIFFLNPAKAGSRRKLNGASMLVLGLDMLFTKKRISQTVGALLVIWRTGGGRDDLLLFQFSAKGRPYAKRRYAMSHATNTESGWISTHRIMTTPSNAACNA